MAIEVFNRYEKKYLVDKETYLWLVEKIKPYMELDKFNKDGKLYNIANIYYDTPSDELIRTSIEKPVYKEKLRLRSYGVPKLSDLVFLEIKKKYEGLVNKRRTKIKLSEAYDLVNNGKKPKEESYINKQVLEEIKYFLDTYNLAPKVYITYDRMAFFDKEDDDFRVTFDTNIKTRRHGLGLELSNEGKLLIGNEYYLMEVKSMKGVPLWFAKLLSEREVYSTSFSKYGTEYKKYLMKRKEAEGEKICLNQSSQAVQEIWMPKEQLFA